MNDVSASNDTVGPSLIYQWAHSEKEWHAPAPRVHIKQKKEIDPLDQILIDGVNLAQGNSQPAILPAPQQQLHGALLQESGSPTTTSAVSSEPLLSHQLHRLEITSREVKHDAHKLKLAQIELLELQGKARDQVAKHVEYPGVPVSSRLPEEAQNMQHVRHRIDAQRAASGTSQNSDPRLEKLHKQGIRIIEWYASDGSVDLNQLEQPKTMNGSIR